MENTSKNFQSFSCQTKENFNEFLKKNEVKEKAFNFIQLSYENICQRADEYKVKEKTIEYAHKTKELMGPFLYQTKAEAKLLGNYLFEIGSNSDNHYLHYREQNLAKNKRK